MAEHENDQTKDGTPKGNNEHIVIFDGDQTHIIKVGEGATDEAIRELAHKTAASLLGISPEELPRLEEPVPEPMSAADVEKKWREFSAEIAIPLSEASIREFVDKEVNKRRQNGLLIEEQ